jgi:integrase
MPRGTGRIFRQQYTKHGVTRETGTWYVEFWDPLHGRAVRESSQSVRYDDAKRLLKRRLGEVATGTYLGPAIEKTTLGEMLDLVQVNYELNGRRSTDRMVRSGGHLRDGFGEDARAIGVTSDRIAHYTRDRLTAGAKPATVNRELACLRRAFRLARRSGKVVQVPYIEMLQEDNVRKGFFEWAACQAVLAQLPEALRPVFEVAYITGWRVKSEILTRQKCHLDLGSGWLRLEPGETKNRKGRMFPLTPRLRAVLELQLAHTRECEMRTGQIIPWLFHRDGRPIKSFRRAWLSACRRAGLAGRIPHDFRRTAVRNLERAGVPRSAAMEMVGHRTESIYRRYAIADEGMLRDGAAKLAALHEADQAASRTILPLPTTAVTR